MNASNPLFSKPTNTSIYIRNDKGELKRAGHIAVELGEDGKPRVPTEDIERQGKKVVTKRTVQAVLTTTQEDKVVNFKQINKAIHRHKSDHAYSLLMRACKQAHPKALYIYGLAIFFRLKNLPEVEQLLEAAKTQTEETKGKKSDFEYARIFSSNIAQFSVDAAKVAIKEAADNHYKPAKALMETQEEIFSIVEEDEGKEGPVEKSEESKSQAMDQGAEKEIKNGYFQSGILSYINPWAYGGSKNKSTDISTTENEVPPNNASEKELDEPSSNAEEKEAS